MKLTFTIAITLFISFSSFGQLTTIYQGINKYYLYTGLDNSFVYKNQYAFVDDNGHASLWLSDGTPENTRIISSSANNQETPVVIQSLNEETIIIVDYDWTNSKYDLYAVTENTKQLIRADIPRHNKLAAADTLAFFYDDGKVWRTNGTSSGTYAIENLSETPNSLNIIDGYWHYSKNGFWHRTDGTNPKETIKPINDSFGGITSNGIFHNGIYYFSSRSVDTGSELWRTDFTDAGTYIIKDIFTGFQTWDTTMANSSNPSNFQILNNEIIFIARTDELWKTDGTANGTVLLKNLTIDQYPPYASPIKIFTTLNGKYIFTHSTFQYGDELWVSDGTAEGTHILKDIFEGTGNGLNRYDYSNFVKHNGYIYFQANNGEHGHELYRTDGTLEGTTIVYDLEDGMRSSYPGYFQVFNDELYFVATLVSGDTSVTNLYKLDLNQLNQVSIPAYDYDIEWLRQFGKSPVESGFNNVYQGDMTLDSEDNIYVTALVSYPHRQVFEQQSGTPVGSDTIGYYSFHPFISKLSTNGDLLWSQYIGGKSYGMQEPVLATTTQDELIVGAGFYSEGRFGNITIPDIVDGGFRIAAVSKFDALGNVLWVKRGLGFWSEIYDITTDENDNIYFIASFSGSSFTWEGENLNSNHETGSVALIKLSRDGSLDWMKLLDGDASWSRGDLVLHKNSLVVSLSDGDRNIWSSCEFQEWATLLAKYSLEGEKIWSNLMTSTDLTTVSDVAVQPNGEILTTGNFRGTYDFGEQQIESPMGNGCHRNVGFVARFRSDGRFMKILTEEDNDMRPYQIIAKENFYYITNIEYFEDTYYFSGYEGFEPNSNKRIVIRKYDNFNNLQDAKTFFKSGRKSWDEWYDNNPSIQFTSDGYTVLADNVTWAGIDTFANFVRINDLSTIIMKFHWEESDESIIFENEAHLKVNLAPNPASDFTIVRIIDPSFTNYNLTIFNNLGQILQSEQKTDLSNQHFIDVHHLQAGTYYFHFQNNNGDSATLKFIKL